MTAIKAVKEGMSGQARISEQSATIFALVAALTLSLTGILKLPSGMTPIALGIPTIAIALLDLTVGVCLLTFANVAFVRGIAAALFGLYAIFNIYQISKGVSECGCFGAISASSKYVAILDVVFVTGLLLSIRSAQSHSAQQQPALLSAIGLGAVMFSVFLIYSPPRNDLELVVSEKQLKSVVDYSNGHAEAWKIRIDNPNSNPIRLIGWNASCGDFRVAERFPIEIESGSFSTVEISFRRKPYPFDDMAKELICQFPSSREALQYSHINKIRFFSDRAGRIEFAISHSQSLQPILVNRVFSNTKGLNK